MIDPKERIGERIDAHVEGLNLAARAVDPATHRDNMGELWDKIDLGKSGWCDACGRNRSGAGWRRDLAELQPLLPPEVPMLHIYLCDRHTRGWDPQADEAVEREQEREDVFPVLSVRLG